MLRLMFLGDRIWGNSGYSRVMHNTCMDLKKLGHSIAHIPMGMAMRGGKFNYHGVLVYPSGSDPFGEDVAVQHYIDFKSDVLISVKDVWVFNDMPRWAINWCPMVPVDHSPVSPSVTARLHSTFKNIAISRFGQKELKYKGVESSYIPHGVQTEIYRPLEERRADCRRMFFFDPEEFVVGIVALNRARKMIPRMLRGYKQFLEWNPDVKSHLMLWTDVNPPARASEEEQPIPGVADVGVNLLPEIMDLGLGEAVRWPDKKLIREGIPEWAGEDYRGGWDMVKLYNSFSVLLLCSGGEGFGLPLLEAQSCGTPVITSNIAAAPELVGSGLTVPCNDYIIFNTPGTRYGLADVDKMAEALSKIVNADPAKLGKKARGFAERFSWENVLNQYWKPFLSEVETELKPLITSEGAKTWA